MSAFQIFGAKKGYLLLKVMEIEDSINNENSALLRSGQRPFTRDSGDFEETPSLKTQKSDYVEPKLLVPHKGRYNKYIYGGILLMLTLGKCFSLTSDH